MYGGGDKKKKISGTVNDWCTDCCETLAGHVCNNISVPSVVTRLHLQPSTAKGDVLILSCNATFSPQASGLCNSYISSFTPTANKHVVTGYGSVRLLICLQCKLCGDTGDTNCDKASHSPKECPQMGLVTEYTYKCTINVLKAFTGPHLR